jgi:hypothetical protein
LEPEDEDRVLSGNACRLLGIDDVGGMAE